MAPLKLAIVAALLAATTPARAQDVSDPVARWRPYVAEASLRFGIPAVWIERVMRAESGGQTRIDGRPITSRAGAMGLMQLMPGTWAEMRAALDLGDDPYDPRDNILAGTAYLRRMYRRFGYPGLFAAYNAGPGRYAAYLDRERTLPAETRTYLEKVVPSSPAWAATGTAEAPPPSIFAVNMVARTANAAAPAAPSNGLFAIRVGR